MINSLQDLRDLFARHCACRPLDFERETDSHGPNCTKKILTDVQIVLRGNDGTEQSERECYEAVRRCDRYARGDYSDLKRFPVTTIKLPDVGDVAPGGVVAPCIADIECMLVDQGLEPTALNWVVVCDHFISQLSISPERRAAFHLLRRAIECAALAAVTIDARPAPPTTAKTTTMPDDHARAMFGCTVAAIDEALAGKSPRDVAMYAMGTLSNAQEYIRRRVCEGTVEWSVADHDANAIRQLINVAKYAIDKAVPR